MKPWPYAEKIIDEKIQYGHADICLHNDDLLCEENKDRKDITRRLVLTKCYKLPIVKGILFKTSIPKLILKDLDFCVCPTEDESYLPNRIALKSGLDIKNLSREVRNILGRNVLITGQALATLRLKSFSSVYPDPNSDINPFWFNIIDGENAMPILGKNIISHFLLIFFNGNICYGKFQDLMTLTKQKGGKKNQNRFLKLLDVFRNFTKF